MNKKKIKIVKIIIEGLFIFSFLYLERILLILIILIIQVSNIVYKQLLSNKIKEKKQKDRQTVFYKYIKAVMLMSYTKPIKVSFQESKTKDHQLIDKEINSFLEDLKYDFSNKPYYDFGYKINSLKKGINYELNILILIHEIDKKGFGKKYIDDVLHETSKIENNTIEKKIAEYQEEGFKYTLPPTVLNFIYITILLFQVINLMLMQVFVT